MTSRRKTRHLRSKPKGARQSAFPKWLILVGSIALIGVIILWKGSSTTTQEAGGALETQLDTALQSRRPVFVFLHSLDCVPCKEMMSIVDEIYPEFQTVIALIDVDVYDKRNASLLRRERLQAIPTLVFYDRQGKRQTFVGVMPLAQFKATLQSLAAGD